MQGTWLSSRRFPAYCRYEIAPVPRDIGLQHAPCALLQFAVQRFNNEFDKELLRVELDDKLLFNWYLDVAAFRQVQQGALQFLAIDIDERWLRPVLGQANTIEHQWQLATLLLDGYHISRL